MNDNFRSQLMEAERQSSLLYEAFVEKMERLKKAGAVVNNVHDEWRIQYPPDKDKYSIEAASSMNLTYEEFRERWLAREAEAMHERAEAKRRGLLGSYSYAYGHARHDGPPNILNTPRSEREHTPLKDGTVAPYPWGALKASTGVVPGELFILYGTTTGRIDSSKPNTSNAPRSALGTRDPEEQAMDAQDLLEELRERQERQDG